MEQAEYSETSAYKIQMPGNYPEENIQHTEHGQSFEIKNTSPLWVNTLSDVMVELNTVCLTTK